MDTVLLAERVAGIDPRLRVEWVGGRCVLHGPASLPVPVEVAALRVVEQEAQAFEWRAHVDMGDV